MAKFIMWAIGRSCWVPFLPKPPSTMRSRGPSIFNYGKWLKEAIESTGRHEVASVPTWEFYRLPPGRYEEILCGTTWSSFPTWRPKTSSWTLPSSIAASSARTLTFPDRVRLTVDALHRGKHIMFLGGWLRSTARWARGAGGEHNFARSCRSSACPTKTSARAPRECRPGRPGRHPLSAASILRRCRPSSATTSSARRACEVIATWADSCDPMFAAGQFGKGRSLAYTSDPAPHWGCNFVYWDQYAKLWSMPWTGSSPNECVARR